MISCRRPPVFVPRAGGGFSLVEVTLALGIVGFALVGVLGLFTVGIEASRDSAHDTTVGLIAQDVFHRLRAEVATVGAPLADPVRGTPVPLAGLDFRWNPAVFSHQPGYAELGRGATTAGADVETAAAYYTAEGTFVREAVVGAATANFYRAAIFVRPLPPASAPVPAASYARLNLVPTTDGAGNPDYPVLAVTVRVGWPAQPVRDGAVRGPVVNTGGGSGGRVNASRATFTFLLGRP